MSFVLGSLILFNSPFYAVSRSLVISVALVTAGFFAFIVAKAVASMRQQATTGSEGLVGKLAEVRTELSPRGTVFLRGELWQAEAEAGPIPAGEEVRVKSVEAMRLRVTRDAQ